MQNEGPNIEMETLLYRVSQEINVFRSTGVWYLDFQCIKLSYDSET